MRRTMKKFFSKPFFFLYYWFSYFNRFLFFFTDFFVCCCPQSRPKIDPAHAISIGCVEVSLKCHAAAIIVLSTSGLSAITIARYRPRCPVLAIVKSGKSARKMSVWRNLTAVYYIGK